MEPSNDQVESQPADVKPEAKREGKPTREARPEGRREPRPVDPRRRLRELLAIPERDRSDAQWDEIIELEIQLAPGNRITPLSPSSATAPGGKKLRGKPRPSVAAGERRSPRASKKPPA